ncbi:MAG: DedA family protein [Alphaproteobacteria bacterium]|nr:DedA family protein [Alphaproteobacteria bacterium]MDD9920171.1 DedA family protein [Alphaproteobacteria bacterium]
MKSLYNRVLYYASRPEAPWVLFIVAFLESSFFPIPPDVLLIPMVLVAFDRAFYYAFLCTLGSVLGGILGYFIGMLAFDSIGQAIIDFWHLESKFGILQQWYQEYDVFIVAAAGFSPIPYKIFTIFSGFMEADFFQFTVASTLSRGARFFLIAWLLWRGGPRFKDWIEKNFYPLTMVGTLVILLLLVLVKVLMA